MRMSLFSSPRCTNEEREWWYGLFWKTCWPYWNQVGLVARSIRWKSYDCVRDKINKPQKGWGVQFYKHWHCVRIHLLLRCWCAHSVAHSCSKTARETKKRVARWQTDHLRSNACWKPHTKTDQYFPIRWTCAHGGQSIRKMEQTHSLQPKRHRVKTEVYFLITFRRFFIWA